MGRIFSVLAALALFGGACLPFSPPGRGNWLACENEGPRHAGARISPTRSLLAIVGLVPALTLVVAAAFRKSRMVAAALTVGVPLYVVWAVLFDAAIHGWTI